MVIVGTPALKTNNLLTIEGSFFDLWVEGFNFLHVLGKKVGSFNKKDCDAEDDAPKK